MKKQIAVIMGGYSSEYEISIQSGTLVCEWIDKARYDVFPIVIHSKGWYYDARIIDTNASSTKITINREDFSMVLDGNTVFFDAVYNMVHGHPGEDGTLQAYFQLLNIPITGSDAYSSALTFNKRDTITIAQRNAIPTATNYFLNKGDLINLDAILSQVGLPCFVKANRAGSSYGISKVNEANQLTKAIDYAFSEDNQIIIESMLVGTEVSIGVTPWKGDLFAFSPTEIVSHTDFFDYEAKYKGLSEEITPARITDTQLKQVQELALKIHKVFGLSGISRSDFIFHNGHAHFIEVNTVPGMSAQSLIPQQIRYAGFTERDVLTEVIESALSK